MEIRVLQFEKKRKNYEKKISWLVVVNVQSENMTEASF